MQHIQYNTIQYNTIPYNTLWYGMVLYCMYCIVLFCFNVFELYCSVIAHCIVSYCVALNWKWQPLANIWLACCTCNAAMVCWSTCCFFACRCCCCCCCCASAGCSLASMRYHGSPFSNMQNCFWGFSTPLVPGIKTSEMHTNPKTNCPKARFWDVGPECWDVGCVRISFAINSNPFPANFDSRSNRSNPNHKRNMNNIWKKASMIYHWTLPASLALPASSLASAGEHAEDDLAGLQHRWH